MTCTSGYMNRCWRKRWTLRRQCKTPSWCAPLLDRTAMPGCSTVQKDVVGKYDIKEWYLQLSTTNHLDPATVIAKTAVIRSHKEVYYFRKSLVQNSVNHQSVESLFYTPAAPSVDTGKVCCCGCGCCTVLRAGPALLARRQHQACITASRIQQTAQELVDMFSVGMGRCALHEAVPAPVELAPEAICRRNGALAAQ